MIHRSVISVGASALVWLDRLFSRQHQESGPGRCVGSAEECPAWCERVQEHNGADDLEHWINHREVDGPILMASLVTYGGRELFEIHLGEHTTVKLHAREAGKLIAALAELMALSTRTGKKQTVLSSEDHAA